MSFPIPRIFAPLDRTDGDGRVLLDDPRSRRDLEAYAGTTMLGEGMPIRLHDDRGDRPVEGWARLRRGAGGPWLAEVRWSTVLPAS